MEVLKQYNLIECNHIDEFWEKLSPEKPLNCSPGNFIFRGQSDSKWRLLPSVLRNNKDYLGKYVYYDEQILLELSLLNNFVEQCDLQGLKILNDSTEFRMKHLNIGASINDYYYKNPKEWPNEKLIELMALAQHHGVPTRLLDWTRRSYVAAYFAASSALHNYDFNGKIKDVKIAIWALETKKTALYRNIKIIKVPGSTSNNLAAQSGVFTFLRQTGQMRELFQPKSLEDEFGQQPDTPLWKITLPREWSGEILERCELYGVTASILFPGYDGAAKAVNDRFNIYRLKDKLKSERKNE